MASNPTTRSRGADTKQAVLDSGLLLLHEHGIQASAIGVDLAEAIERAGVPKSSAYRLFTSETGNPQENFTAELVTALVVDGTHTDPKITFDAATTILAEHADLFETGTPRELADLLRQLIRVGTPVTVDALSENILFRAYVTALVSASRDVPRAGSVEAALVKSETEESPFLQFYKELAELFGARLRPGWSWESLELVTSNASYGEALRKPFNESMNTITRRTGPNPE